MQQTIDFDQPLDQMNKDDLRAKIAHMTGHKPPRRVTKRVLNSAHAWLTGEFYTETAVALPGKPPRHELVDAVALEAGKVACDAYDDEADADNPFGDLIYHVGEVRENDDVRCREFYRPELVALIEAMRETGDQREWVPGGGE